MVRRNLMRLIFPKGCVNWDTMECNRCCDEACEELIESDGIWITRSIEANARQDRISMLQGGLLRAAPGSLGLLGPNDK